MTDLQMTRLCAEAMGYALSGISISEPAIQCFTPKGTIFAFDPLNDDAQAMALVKRFNLNIQSPQFVSPPRWHVWKEPKPNCTGIADVLNLNRAIVECVAKLQAAK